MLSAQQDLSRFVSDQRACLAMVMSAVVGLVLAASVAQAASDRPSVMPAQMEDPNGVVGRVVGPSAALSDTLRFGYVGAGGFAIEGERWTWDHGGADPLEGWFGQDLTLQNGTYFRHIDAGVWAAGGNGVPAPILVGNGCAWVGAFQDEADAMCWAGGLGYGSHWCQRLQSPTFSYSGSGTIDLSFTYFTDLDPGFDYVRVLLRRGDGTEISLNGAGFTGTMGAGDPPVGTQYAAQIGAGDLNGSNDFALVFELESGGFWSDQDGDYDTEYGPFALDALALTGALVGGDVSHGFEADLEGWMAGTCSPLGSLTGVASASSYIYDDCDCGLSGNVLEMHDESREHPVGQHEIATSNPVDVLHDVTPILGSAGQAVIFADWDQMSELPRANGVFYRPGWDYYPYECPVTGAVQWSGRVGQNSFFYNPGPDCAPQRNVATANGVPGNVEQIRFLYELYSSCDEFGVSECSGVTNYTPLLDNVTVGFTRAPNAPIVFFSPSGTNSRFQDTFAEDGSLSPFSTGNCDVNSNVNFGDTPPFIRGDSLYVTGPVSTVSTRWETRLWFRVARKGPAQDQIDDYGTWRDRVADGQDIENGAFAYAWMDSFQTAGGVAARNAFVSCFREDDDDFDPVAGELKPGNEILADHIFVPGSRLEYFVTANYIGNADNYLLPDTSGGNYFEIRFLPEYRDDGGVWKFPALLHIDAGFVGEKMDRMLNVALNGAAPSDPIPAYPAWDRYDNIGGACCWKIPFARDGDPRSTSGITARQLLGYRGVIFSGGGQPTPAWSIDWDLLCSWLSALHCEGEGSPRGLIFHGDRAGTGIISAGPYYLLPRLGVAPDFDSYRTVSGDDNYCVRIEDVAGSSYPPTAAVDAWGSGCPDLKGYEVLSPAASGVGSRAYENVGTGQVTEYQQITNDVNDPILGTYRTVVSSVSYDHLSVREQGDECTQTFDRIVEAGAAELSAALNWIFGGNVPGLHEDPCEGVTDVETQPEVTASGTTRLLPAQPNPFSPRTRLRYELAATGPATLSVFDVGGRRVRVLTSGVQQAGPHEVVWDGTDDRGSVLPAGVYWSQLETTAYRTNKRLVVLR